MTGCEPNIDLLNGVNEGLLKVKSLGKSVWLNCAECRDHPHISTLHDHRHSGENGKGCHEKNRYRNEKLG